MKKKDIIQLVKETVKENTFYGNREQPSQLSTGTKVSAPTDEYPFSAKPKRTATGMMEFNQPKSFDPDTLALVRDMLGDADIHHNNLVGGYDEPSSYLDKRTGGTIIKIPHFNGPPNPALFGKETTDKINASKAAAKTVAAKLYYKFKTYIEDYEISDKSPAGVYGNIYLWMMFNDLAKDYSAPKGGTQSSQFEEIDEAPMFRTGVKMDMAPEVMAPRLKKVFDLVNGAKHPVRTPEWHKNRFKNKYGISFPKTLKGITKDQALAMNKYANDMKNMIKEETYYGKGAMDDMMKDPAFGALTGDAKDQAKKDLQKGSSVSLEALELTNDVGKDDYVDDEGRMAKSQLYKMGKYAVKLHRMLDDMEQLPAWLQAKITKASDYMSMVYHYLDYEFARRDGNLMEEVDKYKEEMLKELTEEPNEGNAFAVARLKAIKAGDKKFKVGDKEFDVTDVSDDDKKAAEEI